MRLTSKGRYAVTAMLDLAFHSQSKPVTLIDIAARQTISLSYLEQLFARLRRANLVKGVRGPGGGYSLCSEPSEITIAEIVAAVGERIDSTKCGGEANCQKHHACLTHDLWMDLGEHIRVYLEKITLADLLMKDRVQIVAERQDQEAQHVIKMHSPAELNNSMQ
jgi:Rrf2 family transcriptional regulator, iron-sulfur cluster assembly transcription factor